MGLHDTPRESDTAKELARARKDAACARDQHDVPWTDSEIAQCNHCCRPVPSGY